MTQPAFKFHLTTTQTPELLLADVIIHKFLDAKKQEEAAAVDEPYTTVYSQNIHTYVLLEGDSFYVLPDAVDAPGGLSKHGCKVRAYSYHSPNTIEMLRSTPEYAGFFDFTNVNEEGVWVYACNRVPDYHQTGEQLEDFIAICKERGQEVQFQLYLQHPHVELRLKVGDYDETFIVTAENIRPSLLMNSAYALIIADYLTK